MLQPAPWIAIDIQPAIQKYIDLLCRTACQSICISLCVLCTFSTACIFIIMRTCVWHTYEYCVSVYVLHCVCASVIHFGLYTFCSLIVQLQCINHFPVFTITMFFQATANQLCSVPNCTVFGVDLIIKLSLYVLQSHSLGVCLIFGYNVNVV